MIKKADLIRKNGRYRLAGAKTILKRPNTVFITSVEADKYALVAYDAQNNPRIELFDKEFNTLKTFEFSGQDNSFNGLAYDEKTSKLCYILLGNTGIVLGTIDINTGRRDTISGPSYIVLNNLSAKDGRVFFGSIESGKDEVYMIDVRDNSQSQITSSEYGSFAGIGGDSRKVAISTYTIDGYMLAEQKYSVYTLRKVDSRLSLPRNTLAVPINDWGSSQIKDMKVKKYSKAAHFFTAPYSWMPIVMAAMSYQALSVHIDIGLNYGGQAQEVYGIDNYDGDLKDYFNVDVGFSMPMNFSGGTNSRVLSSFVNLSFVNSQIFDAFGARLFNYSSKMRYAISYSSMREEAAKGVAPRLGYSLMAGRYLLMLIYFALAPLILRWA